MQSVTPVLDWNSTENVMNETPGNDVERIIIAILIIFISVLCIFGNIFVLFILTRNETLRVVTNGFIAAIAVSDLLSAVISMPLAIVSSIKGSWIFGTIVCQISSFTAGTVSVSSTMTITFLTVDRYLSFENSSRKRTTSTKAAYLIGLSFVVSVFTSIPWYVLVTSSHNCIEFKKTLLFQQCVYQPVCNGNVFWTIYLIMRFLVCFVLPLLVMVICGACICKTLYTSRVKTAPVIINANDIRFSAEVKTAVTVLIIFFIYSICLLPFSVNETVVHLSQGALNSSQFDNFCIIWMWINKAVNPVLYIIRNPYVGKYFCFKRRRNYIDTNASSPKTDPASSYYVGDSTATICCDGGQRRWIKPSISVMFTQRYSIDSENGEATDSTLI